MRACISMYVSLSICFLFLNLNLEHQESLESRYSSTSYMTFTNPRENKTRLWVYSKIVKFSANNYIILLYYILILYNLFVYNPAVCWSDQFVVDIQ